MLIFAYMPAVVTSFLPNAFPSWDFTLSPIEVLLFICFSNNNSYENLVTSIFVLGLSRNAVLIDGISFILFSNLIVFEIPAWKSVVPSKLPSKKYNELM